MSVRAFDVHYFDDIKIVIQDRMPCSLAYAVYGIAKLNGKWQEFHPMELKMKEHHVHNNPPPMLELGYETGGKQFLQALVDAAAVASIFPSGYVPPKAEVDAIRYHLEDMRKLVFK